MQAHGFAGAAELATVSNDWGAAEANSKQAATALRVRDVALPRAQAQLFFANALTAFGEGSNCHRSASVGISAEDHARQRSRWARSPSRIFQSQMVLNLLQGNALLAADAEQALEEILREPGQLQWQREPLETIAA